MSVCFSSFFALFNARNHDNDNEMELKLKDSNTFQIKAIAATMYPKHNDTLTVTTKICFMIRIMVKIFSLLVYYMFKHSILLY